MALTLIVIVVVGVSYVDDNGDGNDIDDGAASDDEGDEDGDVAYAGVV